MGFIEHMMDVLSDFADPRKRVFVGYLGLSIVIAFAWLIAIKRQNIGAAIRKVFDRKVFFSGSARADYKIFVINRAFTFFISPLLATNIAIGTAIFLSLHRQDMVAVGVFNDASKVLVVGLFTLAMFVIDDLTKYLVHRWMHHWPMLWTIHKVHHSAETLTPVTVYRVHPLEGVLYGLRSAVAQGLAIGVFLFLFSNLVDLYTIVGVNVLVFIFHVTGSNLRHSHIDISYWPWLEYLLISPAQHQLHHSIAEEHHDKNFGAALAIWDWLFGSLHLSETEKDLEFGLLPHEASATNMVDIYTRPFVDIYKIARRRVRRWSGRAKEMLWPAE
ncbi:MAG: sterol desaturase family protein [Pseudomonadota bacterium]